MGTPQHYLIGKMQSIAYTLFLPQRWCWEVPNYGHSPAPYHWKNGWFCKMNQIKAQNQGKGIREPCSGPDADLGYRFLCIKN